MIRLRRGSSAALRAARDQSRRRRAREGADLAGQVRLVGEALEGGDLRPRRPGPRPGQRALQAQYPPEVLRAVAEDRQAATVQGACRGAQGVGQPRDAGTPLQRREHPRAEAVVRAGRGGGGGGGGGQHAGGVAGDALGQLAGRSVGPHGGQRHGGVAQRVGPRAAVER
ncbi:MAG TPA: hypothetical protein VK935_12300, partial [Actinomycetospora sp.]|nr:hypothetical protein [Actinomycetospora sp.]